MNVVWNGQADLSGRAHFLHGGNNAGCLLLPIRPQVHLHERIVRLYSHTASHPTPFDRLDRGIRRAEAPLHVEHGDDAFLWTDATVRVSFAGAEAGNSRR